MVETLSSGTILSGHPILGWIKTFRRDMAIVDSG